MRLTIENIQAFVLADFYSGYSQNRNGKRKSANLFN